MKTRSTELNYFIFFITVLCFAQNARANDATDKTEQLLNDKDARNLIIQQDPKAAEANDRVKALPIADAKKDQIYQMSGDIFQSIAAKNDGDPEKINGAVQEYLRNPASIEKDLTPSQRQQIHDLAQ